MARLAGLQGLAGLLLGPLALAQSVPDIEPQVSEQLAEVTVTAPQPRYVAPTRRDQIGRIWAPVKLNGLGPFRLVLDTGANRSAIIASVAQALGERAKTNRQVRVLGATGEAVVPVVRAETMEVGDMLLAPVDLPVVADVFGGAEGVLGNEGLLDKRIVIDFTHDYISVRRSLGEKAGAGFQTLPIAFREKHLLVVDILVGNVRAKAVLDTGAPDTLGNRALLEALRRTSGDTVGTEIVGVTLDVEHGRRIRVPTLRMQDIEIHGAEMTFSDVHIFRHWRMTREPALMIGMDVLGVLDQLVIDYRTRELHLRPANR